MRTIVHKLSIAPLAVTLLSLGLAACGGSSNTATAPTCIAGAACVPSNPCHVGTTICPAGETGSPVCQDTLNNAKDGTACDDGNLCTTGDACLAGVCTGTAKTCAATDQCHNPGVCNPSTGVCSNPVKADGAACNDGNACTQTDTCQAGVCTGSNPVVCGAPDQCHTAGTCNPSNGACSYPNKADGTACNDGNACTQTDTCQAGVCTGSNPITCTALDQCHDAGVCNPSTGVCSNPNKANGSACNDGNACTQTDTCQAGACVGSNPVTCTASDQCHVAGVCDPANGTCSNPAAPNGTTCNDGNACTQTDTCQAGACVGSNPKVCVASDQCHDAGVCNPADGVCSNPPKANGTACNDNNACTQTDTCQAGVCTGSNPKTCTALDQCHDVGVCNPADGVCSNPPKTNGTACNDSNACTTGETCQAGVCSGGTLKSCPASDQCHDVGTCNPADGVCSNPLKANGSACEDGNGCTVGDTCQAGACTAGAPKTCTASDQCHLAGVCDPANGTCTNPAKPDLTACDDGNLCTTGDTCVAGVCTPGTAKTCTASDQCHTAGTCDPATGSCSNPAKANGTACDDANPCTQTDTCQAGVCTGSNPKTCTASDQCHTAGTCDPGTGTCTNPPKTNGTACNDANACTQTDTCQAGVCTGSNPKVCTALDQCHDAGVCNPADGVCSNPNKADGTTCTGASNACYAGACVAVSDVTVTMVQSYWPDGAASSTNYGYAGSGLPPKAYSPTASGYSIIPGINLDGSTVTIPKVPAGSFLLYDNLGTFYGTDKRSIDLGYDILGRPNARDTFAGAGTAIAFNITGLQPWDASYDLAILVCSNVGSSWTYNLGFTFGANSGTYNAAWAGQPMIGTGDTAFLYQLHTYYPGGAPAPFRVADRAAQLAPFAVTSGATTNVAAAMINPATSGSVAVDWKTTQFKAAVDSANAGLPVGQHYFGVLAVDAHSDAVAKPYQPANAYPYMNTVDLVNIEPKEGEAVLDFNYGGSVGYARFLPSPLWQEARLVVYRSYRTFNVAPPSVPPANTWPTDKLWLGVFQQEPMSSVASSPAVPILGPPSSPTFSGPTTAPLLSWTKPALGTPTAYLVQVTEVFAYDYGLYLSGGTYLPCTATTATCQSAFDIQNAWTFYTTDTKVQIPAGHLVAGKHYVAQVSALFRNPEPLTLATPAPLRRALNWARADVLTDLYTP